MDAAGWAPLPGNSWVECNKKQLSQAVLQDLGLLCVTLSEIADFYFKIA